MCSDSTQMSNSSRKLHSIHILVLVHNATHNTFRLVFNFSSFPPRPMNIEVWPIFKLKMSTADLHNTILDGRSSVNQSVGTLLSAILNIKLVNSDTPAEKV